MTATIPITAVLLSMFSSDASTVLLAQCEQLRPIRVRYDDSGNLVIVGGYESAWCKFLQGAQTLDVTFEG